MKITINQQVSLKVFNKGWFNMKKTYESDVIPHKGDYITDTVWKDPYEYEVIETVIDYNNNSCDVSLERMELDTNNKEYLNEWKEICKLHGWDPGI